ncbi:MAG TPA: MurT ligase domain-containing protein [Coriobacteriia bacterium]|jgi:UDP-N-acetylmuramyl tripeptide synthase
MAASEHGAGIAGSRTGRPDRLAPVRRPAFDPLRAAAIIAGKTTASATRLFRVGGGTSLPGLVADRVHPGLVRELAERVAGGFIVVTGTNGKTTTTKMLSGMLRRDGTRVISNDSGSNLHRGISSSLIRSADILGRGLRGAEMAVLEVDEGSMPDVVSDVRPRIAVAMNFVRDQLDRYGEVDSIVATVGEALAGRPDMTTVLNADDPYVAGLGRYAAGPVVYYGLDDPVLDPRPDPLLEAMYCRRCGHELAYRTRYYGHNGDWHCPNCGLERPPLDYAVTDIALTPRSSAFSLLGQGVILRIELPVPALYNVYNAAAAATASFVYGVPSRAVAAELRDYRAAFGRMETLDVDGRDVILLLSKNPVAARQALAAVLIDEQPKHLAFALNDNFADGRDISWIWDVDFEDYDMARHTIVATGTRAEDMALRLKYAGVPAEGIVVERDPGTALRELVRDMPPGGLAYALATYTAMIAIRNAFAHDGSTFAHLGRLMRGGNA